MSSWSLRSSRSGGWRKTEHARITAALVLRKGRPAARKVYKLIPDIPVLRQSSKPRVFVRYAQAFVVGGHVDCTPVMQDHRQNGASAVPVELQKHDRLAALGLVRQRPSWRPRASPYSRAPA